MKKYIPILKGTRLFAGVDEQELTAMFDCLQARMGTYKKGECVFRRGERMGVIAVPVEGSLRIQHDDYWGNRSIVGAVGVGEMFGEAYAAPDSGAIMNDVVAAEDSAVIFFDAGRILTVCSSACLFHSRVVENLFCAVAGKNRGLVRKLEHMSRRTTREKLFSYLSDEAERQGGSTFAIPFNRQELADYLSVDRSAMSAELGRMRDDGLLVFEKNRFTLLEREV